MKQEITQAVLDALLHYDRECGNFRWKERSPRFFSPSKMSQQSAANIWNSKFADTPALTTIGKSGYYQGRIFNAHITAHRAAWILCFGIHPEIVDHINGNRLDNRLANLRSVTTSENGKNKALWGRNNSGVMGVSFEKSRSKWKVQIGDRFIGRFDDFQDAVAARRIAEVQGGYHDNHGKRPNFYAKERP